MAAPVAACAIQWLLWAQIQPFVWFLFFPAVFIAARIAGVRGGVLSAILSSVLVVYLFLPPRLSFSLKPGALWMVAIFVVMGYLFGRVHEGLAGQTARAESILSETEHMLQGIREQSVVGIYLIQDDRFAYVNDEFARIFGFESPEEIVGRFGVDAIVAPDDRERVTTNVRRRQAGELDGVRYSFKGLRKDGVMIDVHVQGRQVLHEGRPAIVGVCVDNTERVRALQQLHQRDKLLLRTSKLGKVGGWQFEVPSMEGEWTDEVALIHDLDPADSTDAHKGLSFYEGWSKAAIERAVKDAIEHQQPYDLEVELVSAKGARKWVRTVGYPVVFNGKTVRVEGTMQDITERMEAQQALRRSEERYRSLVEQTVDGIFLADGEGRYLDVNPAGCAMLGYSFSEMISLNIADVIDPSDVSRIPSEVARFAGGQVARSEWLFRRKDGTCFYGEVLGRQLPDGRLLGILRDVTERKEAERLITELNVDLERKVEQRTAEVTAANRELESFAYAVSHDLRAPLRAMSGFCRALQEDYADDLDEQGRRYIEHVVTASKEMGALIDALLVLSRATRGDLKREDVDVSALAQRLVDQRRLVHPDRDVHVEIEPGLHLCGDAKMIEVLFQNLISNAWKYTGATPEPSIRVYSDTDAEGHWISIADNGAGFDPRYAGQLFEPFHRLHRQDEFPGLGIGLATVQRIVNRHGGAVRATAAPSEGATFAVRFPDDSDVIVDDTAPVTT